MISVSFNSPLYDKYDHCNSAPAAKGFDYTGFPTLFWVPAGGEPIKYEGGRTLEDWEAYIAEQRGAKDEL